MPAGCRATRRINAPADTVWRHLTDFNAYPGWMPFAIRVLGLLNAGAELMVCARIAHVFPFGFRARIVRLERGRSFAWQARLVFGLLTALHEFRIEPEGPARCRILQQEAFSGPLAPLLTPLLNPLLEAAYRRIDDELAKKAYGS